MQKIWLTNLQAKRIKKGLTQEELAWRASHDYSDGERRPRLIMDECTLGAAQIALYEQGRRKPRKERLQRIEAVVGATKWVRIK